MDTRDRWQAVRGRDEALNAAAAANVEDSLAGEAIRRQRKGELQRVDANGHDRVSPRIGQIPVGAQ